MLVVTCYGSCRTLDRGVSFLCSGRLLSLDAAHGTSQASPAILDFPQQHHPLTAQPPSHNQGQSSHVSTAPSARLRPWGHMCCPLLFLWLRLSQLQPWRLHLQSAGPSPPCQQTRAVSSGPLGLLLSLLFPYSELSLLCPSRCPEPNPPGPSSPPPAMMKHIRSPAASMAKSNAGAQCHVTQEQHWVVMTPTFLKCSLTSETPLLFSSVLGCIVFPQIYIHWEFQNEVLFGYRVFVGVISHIKTGSYWSRLGVNPTTGILTGRGNTLREKAKGRQGRAWS